MKKGIIIGMILMFSLFSISTVLAEPCDLQVSMVNQDPYPAIPGEEVKMVFQIDGIQNTECGNVEFQLVEKYPISIAPGEQKVYKIESGTFKKDFKSFFLASYKVIVSGDTIDGDAPIEVKYRSASNIGYETKDFNLHIEDTTADFEVHVKDYDYATKILTFEILNIAENDVEALTIEVPKQETVLIKGANRNIVGDLDSNDYTTAEFTAVPTDGEIELLIHYSDEINERRVVSEKVPYESSQFMPDAPEKKPLTSYLIYVVIVGLIVWWVVRRRKKKKELEAKLKSRK